MFQFLVMAQKNKIHSDVGVSSKKLLKQKSKARGSKKVAGGGDNSSKGIDAEHLEFQTSEPPEKELEPRIQKIKITLGNEKANEYKSNFVTQDSQEESFSDASSSTSEDKVNGEDDGQLAIRKPRYWLEMKGMEAYVEKCKQKGKVDRKAMQKKRKIDNIDTDDESGRKERKLAVTNKHGKKRKSFKLHAKAQSPKSRNRSRYVRKDPPSYPAGSREELWYLEILEKGKITCPTCKAVMRKTVEGLKKHMANCKEEPFVCQHCGKQLKSLAGLKYHLMADHNNMPILKDGDVVDEQTDRERLRKVLRRMGRLKCLREDCGASFTSIMGYLYHLKKCGKEESELVKQLFKCPHCGKLYKSKAGLDYHLKSEHAPSPETTDDEAAEKESEPEVERTSSGRVRRSSAKLAAYHLHEIVADELTREWPRRKIQRDLVPDDDKLKYTRPGLPTFSHEVLRKWNHEMKTYKRVQCPNKDCGSNYTSVSGLKAHLGSCTRGEYVAGKYKCLLCVKEFSSESGVKYHINNVHFEDWFLPTSKAAKEFKPLVKFSKKQPKMSTKKKTSTKVGKKQNAQMLSFNPVSFLKKVHEPSKERDQYRFTDSEEEQDEQEKVGNWRLKRPSAKAELKTDRAKK
ncbi:zinc finger protein 512 isoform X1 [Scyliorhinus canicula]|uniref:zinc finger protein 512 isoform X1 n=2 Tax=Scyliorhinus canicula TaxID=7830 RepID=UPI0018F2B96E|nr:zinc finger protein 512 isoform X1 [Scyliorhinus canicula]